jgi:hypothetical protein
MPHLNHTGPENEGPKTGRKLGKCHKTDDEQILAGELEKGLVKRRLSGGGKGKGNRLKYNQL